MNLRDEGKRSILLTGASTGIGAHCARALAAEGWRVFATARKPEDLEKLRADGLEAVHLDYSDPQSIAAAVETVLEATGGRLDALFNNGAYAQPGRGRVTFRSMRSANSSRSISFGWHRSDAPHRARDARAGAWPHRALLLHSGPRAGRAGADPMSRRSTRWKGLMLCLRLELEGSGIEVSLIEPGPIDSRFAANALSWFEKKHRHRGLRYNREHYQAELARNAAGRHSVALQARARRRT